MDGATFPGGTPQGHAGVLRLSDDGLEDPPSGLVVADDSGLRRGLVPARPSDEALRAALSAASFPPAGSVLLARSDDGLFLWLFLVNLDVQSQFGAKSQLVLHDPAKDGFLVLGLPPQAVFEQAVFDAGSSVLPPALPAPAESAGLSRLVLRVPKGGPPVTYDLATLLNIPAFPLSVSPVADNGSGITLPQAPPGPTETAIESPWRLVLSPSSAATFSAQVAPVTRNDRTELWHARLAARSSGGADQHPGPVPFRAVWSPDLPVPGGSPLPGTGFPAGNAGTTAVAMTPEQRAKLVAATTTSDVLSGPAAPANASLLLVSSMGASLDVLGAWPTRNDVIAWRHRSWLGRDNYVRIDEPGFLFPWGFRAARVSVTERIPGGRLAFLRQRRFIVVREPTVHYPGLGQPNAGRNLPFSSVTTTTIVSPPLVASGEPIGAGGWVQIADPAHPNGRGIDLRYHLILTGQDGGRVMADFPLVFVPAGSLTSQGPSDPAYDPSQMGSIRDAYNAADAGSRRTLHLNGQKLGFVPPLSPPPGGPPPEETSLPTSALVLEAELSTASALQLLTARQLNGFPKMATAKVHLEALDAVGGTNASTEIKLDDKAYTPNGFGGTANPGEVWAVVVGQIPNLAVPQQTGGGLVSPSLDVGGLSRAFGPVRDAQNIAKGDFHPDQYFPLDSITLLGGIKLKDVIGEALGITDPRSTGVEGGVTHGQGDQVPKVVTTRTATAVDTVVTWRPMLQGTRDGLFLPGDPTPPATPSPDDRRLDLRAVFHTDLANPGAVTQTVTGDMRNFSVNFVGNSGDLFFIKQRIHRLHFESRNGAKPTVDIQLGSTDFEGDLHFLAELQRFLPALPGGVKIDVTPDGIAAGLSVAVPAVTLGVLTLQNLAIGALLNLPFNGDPASLLFSFATREHPFTLTVSLFGGGGFLVLDLSTRGVQGIEGSLEFAAVVALNLGVASGSVSVMAGIYLKFAQCTDSTGSPKGPLGNTVVITGFVRAIGELEVLGLITISAEFYLGLGYSNAGGQKRVQGDATLVVRVEVALFSQSVSLSMHKEFSGGQDPGFGDQLSAGDWTTYCAAFAAG